MRNNPEKNYRVLIIGLEIAIVLLGLVGLMVMNGLPEFMLSGGLVYEQY